MNIETKFGTFSVGEGVVAVMYGYAGRDYLMTGKVLKKREYMGREILVLEDEHGQEIDVCMINASRVASGDEARKIWSKWTGEEVTKPEVLPGTNQTKPSPTSQTTNSRYMRV